MNFSQEVQRRLKELHSDVYQLRRFDDYVKATADNKRPTSLSNKALLHAYDDASADYHRYGVWDQRNLAIATLAAERMEEISEEILNRMGKK